ncbi:MAG: hypothetical protein IPM95_06970 [Sphingobacteriales bacterium]|nr:hypothetical protein [Sphingobacteriales bacterium]
MKKIIIISFLFLALKTNAQDTAKIYNLSLQSRLISFVSPICTSPENDSLFTTFLNWRAKYRATNPQPTTVILTDSIPTVELAKLYNYCLSNSDGLSISSIFKSSIQNVRDNNAFLNRLCTAYELYYQEKFALMRQNGKRLLMGKD